MMFRRFFQFSATTLSADKSSAGSLLASLRKKTGYSIANCKKALEISGNDLSKAESWLNSQAQAQGWDKAAKLQNRATLQGVVGIVQANNEAAMVEVNCETDFVARNEKFQSLVAKAASVCLSHIPKSEGPSILNVKFSSEQLGAMHATELNSQGQHPKLSDLVALNIGQIGENMNLRRGTAVKSLQNNIKLVSCSHPFQTVGDVMIGKYGAIVAYETGVKNSSEELPEGITADKLPRQLCQHVIGMNPRTVEKSEDSSPALDGEETVLYDQEFVASPGHTVGQILDMVGWRVHAFVRYECGESD